MGSPTASAAALCESIAELPALTTADVHNIVLALRLRISRTPLEQPQRNSVAKLLGVTEAGLTGIWMEGGAR